MSTATQTIEQTGKTWKLVKLSAWVLIILGFCVFDSDLGEDSAQNILASFIFAASIPAWFAGKFGAWWFHG